MAIRPETLAHLEACGVTQLHLDALLRFLRCGENGSYTWHVHQGRVERCEVRMTFTARGALGERIGCVVGENMASE